jgi:gentisate 1,2-dioxygenase
MYVKTLPAEATFEDVSGLGYAECAPWKPVVVSREQIAAEIARLADEPRPANGRRAALIVHPQATAPGLGFAPGIDVTINVLKPGEETVPVRRNSNQLEICIGGSGTVRAGGEQFVVEEHDIWNIPGMQAYTHRNTGNELWARLSYSNAPLLEKLGAHYFEEDPPPLVIDSALATSTQQKNKYARENAPDFAVTPDGARLRGYEFLVDIEVLESKAIHWPWKAVRPHLAISGNPDARGILLLYNPATERRNGTTHSFFATLGGMAPNTPQKTAPAGHRHTSAAVNYRFISDGGYSIVDGERYDFGGGSLMLAAPSWTDHAHSYRPAPRGTVSLTVQDHPLHIGMESLIWQEDLNLPILTLGSQAGVTGYVGPRKRGD